MIEYWYSKLSFKKQGTDNIPKILSDHKKYNEKNYKWLSNFLFKVIK